ncbi:hypothetical protein TURU_096979 [Turdus rufiventris]|nr:hypothetical protein TURU_096979 [Turdus rufiventris]
MGSLLWETVLHELLQCESNLTSSSPAKAAAMRDPPMGTQSSQAAETWVTVLWSAVLQGQAAGSPWAVPGSLHPPWIPMGCGWISAFPMDPYGLWVDLCISHGSPQAGPHIIFLSQSVLPGGSHLCGTRLCHEIAHAWFGLAIGARDWTEEWISEGFATFLEDIFWARAQQLSHDEIKGQQELKALLRWRRLRDEVQNSEEELQVLRPKKENTGELSESGASVVKYGLKAEKIFMQVHYLKGYFLLRSLARTIGEVSYLASLRKFVIRFHGQLVLSQDFLSMLLEDIPKQKGSGLTVESIFQNWLDTSGIPKAPFSYWKAAIRFTLSLLQAEQTQLSLSFHTRVFLHSSSHLGVPPLDSLQQFHILPVQAPQSWMQGYSWGLTEQSRGAESPPSPAAYAALDATQDTFDFLGWECPWLGHVQPLTHSTPKFFSSVHPQPGLVPGVVPTQVQHLALGLVKSHEIPMGLVPELLQVPLDGILSFRHRDADDEYDNDDDDKLVVPRILFFAF